MNLKNILKTLKLNESSISMFLGALVVVIVGVLVFNYFRKGGETTETADVSEEEGTEATAAEVGKTYTVKAGDTLWKIAESAYGSGYNWTDIAKANSINTPGVIEVGQKLEIPLVEVKTPTTSDFSLSVEESDKEVSVQGTSYTVVKGDTLWGIAVKAYGDGYRWVDIARENKLVNPGLIHAGNELTLPR